VSSATVPGRRRPGRQRHLEGVEQERDQAVVTAQGDQLDQSCLPEKPLRGVIGALAQPAALAQQALATMHLPAPRIGMSPPNTAEIVNFQDWLWVDSSMWHPISATASVGSVAATATATPQRVVYDMGDGNQVVCSSAGTPYNPATAPGAQSTSCSYRYANSSAGQPNNLYAASATIYWHVTWTAVGAPGGGDLGEIPGDTATTQVAVDEVQALNTASR